MADSRDEQRRRADLEWLYGSKESDEINHTRRLDDAEVAELRKRGNPSASPTPRTANPAPSNPAPSSAAPAGFTGSPAANPEWYTTSPRQSSSGAAPRNPQPNPQPVGSRSGAVATASSTQRGSAAPPPGAPRQQPDSRPPGRPVATRRRRRRHPFRWMFTILLLLVVWYGGVPLYAWSGVRHVDAMPSGDRPAQQPGTAILLVGSDNRTDMTAEERAKLGTGGTDISGTRTDSMMILYVPPSGRSVLLSLPRDSFVSIPGYRKNKLNAAFALGGPKLLMQTVETATGLRIDGYLEIGMGGFANVIDSLGGIKMCLPNAINDKDSHINLPAGCQTLDGKNALGYVRMRKADPAGDIGRTKRQREMIAAVGKKATSPLTLLNPVKYWRFSMAVRDAMQQDGLGVTSLPTLVKGMLSISGGSGLTLSVPTSSTNTMTSAGSSVIWDHERASAMFAEMALGDTAGLDKYAK